MSNANASARAAVQRRRQTKAGAQPAGANDDFRVLLERQKPEIARALTGTALDPERFTRIALTTIKQSRGLMACRPQSVLGALMTCAQLGLEPGPLGEAWLVPYKDVCTFIPGYRGLIKLAWQSEKLRHIDAHVVNDGDDFDYAYGLEPFLRHKPTRGKRGEITDVYACATFHGGGSAFVVLSVEDVEGFRNRSAAERAGKDSPWKTDWDAMAKKTAIRQLAKFLPMSTGLSRALVAEGTVRTSVTETVEEVAGTVIDGEVVEPDAPEPAAEQDPQPANEEPHTGEE